MDTTSFVLYCAISTFTPGPTNIVILSTVHRFGARKAMSFTYGATVGFCLLLAISSVLNQWLVAILPDILFALRIAGSLYMVYLAYILCRAEPSNPTSERTATFLSGMLMQFMNPKVVLFTLTVIPTFILPYSHAAPVVTAGVAAITLIGFAAFTTWVLFGALFREFLRKHDRIVGIAMASLLVGAAALIWIR